MNLIYQHKKTNSFHALEEAIAEGFIKAVGHRMRQPGERVNWPDVSKLLEAGYLEVCRGGPRGGKRYQPTAAGRLVYAETVKLLHQEAAADWFRTYYALPGVFAGEDEVKAALDAYPGNRTIGGDVQAFADHGAITARVRAGIEGTAPDMPEIGDLNLIDREPETPEELHAWLAGFRSHRTPAFFTRATGQRSVCI